MFLYWLASENRYVHRQSDIPKGVEGERVDVPTNTEGLMGYLNNLVLNRGRPLDHPAPGEQLLTSPGPVTLGQVEEVVQVYMDEKPIEVQHQTVIPPHVAQMEQQITVEEAIQTATPHQLAKYAENVCWRIKELAGKL